MFDGGRVAIRLGQGGGFWMSWLVDNRSCASVSGRMVGLCGPLVVIAILGTDGRAAMLGDVNRVDFCK